MTTTEESQFLLYQLDDGQTRVEVRLEGETVWLTLDQLARLFQRDKSVISRHLKSIFADGELDRSTVVARRATTALDQKTYQVDHYALDVVVAVGYRVRSARGTQFRQWATERLREYLVKGFALDDSRLKRGGGPSWSSPGRARQEAMIGQPGRSTRPAGPPPPAAIE